MNLGHVPNDNYLSPALLILFKFKLEENLEVYDIIAIDNNVAIFANVIVYISNLKTAIRNY